MVLTSFQDAASLDSNALSQAKEKPQMKPLALVALTALVGVTVGWTVSRRDQTAVTNVFGPITGVVDASVPLDVEPRPVMTLLDGTVHSFGRMERGDKGACEFRIRNDGNATLELKVLKASCKCTRADVLDEKVEPGETTKLQLEWEAVLPGIDPEFRQEAPVVSNDPSHRHTVFAIAGELFFAVEAKPSRVSLGNIRSSARQEGVVEVVCNTQDDFGITDVVLQDESLRDYVEFEILPLSEERVQHHQAKSGVKVQVVVKPGLPPGRFHCQANLQTSALGVPVPLSIEAQVVGEISILGEGYSLATNTLTLGTVARAEGREVKLLLLVKGEHHDKTTFSVGAIDPAVGLEVEVGEPRPLKSGAITQFPLFVRVPKGAPLVNRRGTEQAPSGSILVETTHPRIKRIQIWVRYAVE